MNGGLQVLGCDNHVLAVAKPAGLPVVPDASGDESLLDLARAWVGREFEKPGRVFLGVVHRLDRPVSGVVVFARTSKSAARLAEQFRNRTVGKLYWGIGAGLPAGERGELELWLSKDRRRNRVAIHREARPGAQQAATRWRLTGREVVAGEVRCRLVFEPRTGRPHQLRATAAALGCPLLGDLKYGAAEALPDGSIALHARSLELDHPTRHERLRFECDPPARPWWRRMRDSS